MESLDRNMRQSSSAIGTTWLQPLRQPAVARARQGADEPEDRARFVTTAVVGALGGTLTSRVALAGGSSFGFESVPHTIATTCRSPRVTRRRS